MGGCFENFLGFFSARFFGGAFFILVARDFHNIFLQISLLYQDHADLTMQSTWPFIAGVVAVFFGFANLENASRGLILRPMAIFWSLVAGFLCYHNFLDLYHAGDLSAVAGFGLLFGAVSPILGWLWWGHDGLIRKRIFKALAFLFLTAVGFALWSLALGTGAEVAAMVLAILTACIPFLGIRRRVRQWRWRSRARRERRRAEQQARREELRLQRQQRAVARDEQRTERLERDLEAKDRRIADLKSREAQRVADRQQRRREISEQVRLLREQEVTGLRESDGAGRLSFHPHYGPLMAEAWRVLRAQLVRGERIPAAEHDAFFYQVVDELLAPDDFEGRYFHSKGRKAIAAVDQYLGGREPLATVQRTLARLKLGPTQLAPEPLPEYSGRALLEAWLVPHRRFQHRLWEDFRSGRHPRQELVLQHLRELKRGLPSPDEWRTLWDENPQIFAGSVPGPASFPIAVDGVERLWKAVSSIWNDAKAR